jgi:hypothetical protein
MLKVKQFGVAAAIALISGSAMASNFRAADQIYVPSGGHISTSTTTFLSDVFISNLSATDSVDVSVVFASGANPQASNNTLLQFPKILTLAPNERRELPDFVSNNLHLSANLGQLIFNACKAGADCTPDSSGLNPNYRDISVESRIFSVAVGTNPSTAPTVGQLFSGIPWYNYVSEVSAGIGLDKVFITGVRNTAQYRTNIGFVNASQYSSTTITAKLFDGKTNNLLAQNSFTLQPLGTFGPVSVSTVFSSFVQAPTSTNAYITFEQGGSSATSDAAANGCPNGCPAFLAYGSQLDNQTTDATTLEPQYLKRLTDAAQTCIYFPDQIGCNQKSGATPHRAVKH